MSRSTEITGLRGRERLAAALREQSYPALCLCWGAIGLVLSMGKILGGSAPFGVALTAGMPLPLVLPSAVGGILGYLLGNGMGGSFPLVGALLLTALTRWTLGLRWEKHPPWMGPALAGGTVFLTGVAPLLYKSPLIYDVVMWGTQVVMGTASASFLERGVRVLRERKTPADRLDSTALCVLGALLIMGLDSTSVGGVTLGRTVAVTVVLFAARVGSEGLAASAGLVCGLAVGFATGDFPPAITVYGLGGLLAGIFSVFGRTGSTLAFLMTYGAISAMTAGNAAGFIEVALGAFLFLMVPLPWFRLGAALLRPAASDEEAVKLVVEEQLQSAAVALRDVSQTTRDVARRLGDLSGMELAAVYDQVGERLCRGCPYRLACWEEQYGDTVKALARGMGQLRQGKPLSGEDLLEGLARCQKREEIANYLTGEYRLWVGREEGRLQASRTRSVVTGQFDGLALALEGVGEAIGEIGAGDRVLAAKVKELFLDARMEPQGAVCWKNRQGRTVIKVTVPRYKMTRAIPAELMGELAAITDLRFGCPILTDGGRWAQYTFYEHAAFAAEYGACQLIPAGNKLCGDSYRLLTLQGGAAHLVLSDGMGSGGGAAVDSTMAAALITRLLEAGLSCESALHLVNSALAVKSGEESLATVDGVRIDLYTGQMEIYKAGAAPTVVVRDGRSLTIDSNSLPAGILSQVNFEKSSISLGLGDLVILLSDGATTQGSDWIARMAEEEKPRDLNEFCKKIATTARLRRDDGREDDITVLCCRLVNAT
jgi:stage II sporulation protein E